MEEMKVSGEEESGNEEVPEQVVCSPRRERECRGGGGRGGVLRADLLRYSLR